MKDEREKFDKSFVKNVPRNFLDRASRIISREKKEEEKKKKKEERKKLNDRFRENRIPRRHETKFSAS